MSSNHNNGSNSSNSNSGKSSNSSNSNRGSRASEKKIRRKKLPFSAIQSNISCSVSPAENGTKNFLVSKIICSALAPTIRSAS